MEKEGGGEIQREGFIKFNGHGWLETLKEIKEW